MHKLIVETNEDLRPIKIGLSFKGTGKELMQFLAVAVVSVIGELEMDNIEKSEIIKDFGECLMNIGTVAVEEIKSKMS
jgi:hypothetical protein